MSFCGLAALVLLELLVTGAPPADAQTLNEAMASAYRTNPELGAARARLRATDENVARARSGFRPTISGTADYGMNRSETGPPSASDGRTKPGGFGVTLNQPVFRGLRTLNAVRGAKAGVDAAREDLRSIEQSVLLNAATVYVNVVRDRSILTQRENNAGVLGHLLQATIKRMRAGQATTTDVAQARARRAAAVSLLQLAKANLQTSYSDFERIIGYLPGRNLQMPTTFASILPQTLDEAIAIGVEFNPAIASADYRQQNARFATREIQGQLLPQVNVEARYDRNYNSTRLIDDSETASVIGRVTVPFYQAGDVHAQIRQSLQNESAAAQDRILARRSTRANVIAAWTRLAATRAQMVSDEVRVTSSQTALDGVRQEQHVGQRTVLDVLDAERELVDALVQQVSTRRDKAVAAFSLLATIGHLTAATLQLPTEIYDPQEHLAAVEHKPWGITITRTGDDPHD